MWIRTRTDENKFISQMHESSLITKCMHINQNDYKTQIIKWLLECGTTEKAGKSFKADGTSSIEHSETHVLIFTKADTYAMIQHSYFHFCWQMHVYVDLTTGNNLKMKTVQR